MAAQLNRAHRLPAGIPGVIVQAYLLGVDMIRTAAAALALLAALAAPAAAQEKIRIAGNFELEHSSTVAIEKFKKSVEAATGGQLVIETFPAMQLGGAKENVDQTPRRHDRCMTWVGMAFLSRIVPELEAVSLPFVFPNREVAFRVMDGEVGVLLDKKLADKGFISLGLMELGARQVTNSERPIKTIDDLKGLKIRLQPNETHLATFRALGANAVAMDIHELYSALEQKVIDGQENPYTIISRSRFFEVQKYLSNTGHFFDFIAIVANRKQFDGAASRNTRRRSRRDEEGAAVAQRQRAVEAEREALAELQQERHAVRRDARRQVREQMRKATAGVVEQIKKRAGADLVDRSSRRPRRRRSSAPAPWRWQRCRRRPRRPPADGVLAALDRGRHLRLIVVVMGAMVALVSVAGVAAATRCRTRSAGPTR